MDVLIFLLLALPVFILFLLQKPKIKRNLHLPPGPQGLPLIGNLHKFRNSTPHRYLWQLSKKYGPLMSLRLGSSPVLIVSSAKMAKEVMKTHDFIFCSRPPFLSQQRLSYNGSGLVFAPYDDSWRETRKICTTHLFNFNRVQSFRPIREFEVSCMLEKISKLAVASKPVNLTELMISLTSTIICRVAFGNRYEEEGVERSRFRELLKETQDLFTSFFVSDYFPLLGFVDRLTGQIHRLEKNFQEFDNFFEQIIQEHLDPSRPKPEQNDILDVLLQIWKDNSSKIQLTFDLIKAVLKDVFVGGTETSAATVVWAMTYLMQNPKAMKKAQEEVRNKVEEKGFVDEDDIQQLSYLKAVIKETMRLQPPVPLLLPREISENCKLDGYDIAAKTVVHVNAWAIGRDPQVWENPQDFCPERFIGNSIDLKGQNFELVPFGAGRRSCPGIFMGLANVELALANLVYKFNWEMPGGIRIEDLDMDVQPGITMHKKNALCLMPSNI